MVPLWYLFSTIILTIFFFILSNIFNNYFIIILIFFSIFTYVAQYSHFYDLLNGYKNNIKMPIEDTISILPLTIMGIIFYSLKLIEFFKINKKMSIFISYLFIFFIFKYDIFVDLGGYKGIVHIFTSTSFFVAFYLLPLDNINSCIKRAIKQITSYTNGIYCMQSEMVQFIHNNFHREGNLNKSIIIYLVSYFFSFIGYKIFRKTQLKYLFI